MIQIWDRNLLTISKRHSYRSARGCLKAKSMHCLLRQVKIFSRLNWLLKHVSLAMQHMGRTVPVIGNVTLDQYGKMLLGTTVQAAYTTICDMGISVFGLNCSTGPVEMTPSIRWLNEQEDLSNPGSSECRHARKCER